MKNLFYLTFFLQGVLIVWDELYFHRRRQVPRWERIGHPLDTLVFMIALLSIWLWGTDSWTIGLSVFSTLFITKDEWVHQEHCRAMESWLHSLLFILHPVILILAHKTRGDWGWDVFAVLSLAFIYQTLYWNFYAPNPIRN